MTRPQTVQDGRRAGARREMLRAALRSGDASVGARAAARARLEIFGLAPDEARHASAARRRFGRALRDARARRSAVEEVRTVLTIASPEQRARTKRFVPVSAIAVAAIAGLILSDTAHLPPPPVAARETPGCVRAMQAPLRAQGEEDIPMAPPPEYYGPAFIDAEGGGIAPIVDPYRSGPIAAGFVRLIGRVLDDATALPVEDACVLYTYGIVRFRAGTDARGIFITDLPAGTLPVDLRVEHVDHGPVRLRLQPWGESQVRFFLNVRMPSP
jgi:hypothetical protein